MNVLFYAPQQSIIGARLQSFIQEVQSLHSLINCWKFDQLRSYFCVPHPLPEMVILLAEDREELAAFESFSNRLDQVFFVLVVPDTDDETIACGHRLRPRFLAYHDSDFSDVKAVVEQYGMQLDREMGGAVPVQEKQDNLQV